MELQEFSCSDQLGKFLQAYSSFQMLDLVSIKAGVNPHFKSSYSKLPDVLDLVRVPMAKLGLSIIQMPLGGVDTVRLVVRLAHLSGEFMQWIYTMPLLKKDAQGVAATTTYLRRISLLSCLGLPEEDDDGNLASVPPAKTTNSLAPPPPPPPTNRPPAAGPSAAQITRLYTIATNNGYGRDTVHDHMKDTWGISSTKQLTRQQYDILCNEVLPLKKILQSPDANIL